MKSPELSVVIPAYNEDAVIRETISAITRYLDESGVSHEIIVVDDGSSDATVPQVRALAEHNPAIRLMRSGHRGKGGAVKLGLLESQGRWVLFMDADYSTPIEEWAKCAPYLAEGYEVVIGSRKMPGAQIHRRQPFVRELMGKAFTRLTNGMLSLDVSDVTCGFKCYKTEAVKRILEQQRIDGWGFDAELLFIARRMGYRIKEVPVKWTDDASTKVKLLQDAVRSFSELATIRYGAWRGYYSNGTR